MDFKNKIVIVTGGAQGIGRCIAEEFEKLGATVCVIDKQQGDHFVGDLADKQVLEQFVKEVIALHGHVDYLINNALPLMKGINECSYEEFQYALSVGVTAPFYLAKLFAPHFGAVLHHLEGRVELQPSLAVTGTCRYLIIQTVHIFYADKLKFI